MSPEDVESYQKMGNHKWDHVKQNMQLAANFNYVYNLQQDYKLSVLNRQNTINLERVKSKVQNNLTFQKSIIENKMVKW